MTWDQRSGQFKLGDVKTLSGEILPDAVLSWKAHGRLNAARDNVILYPTSYGAQHPDLEWLIHPDGVLDPTRWFIVIPDMFGIERLACVYGWSMGAQQAYHWAALFPDQVARIVVNCGSARTAVHNKVFLLSLMATLEAAPEHLGNGRFSSQPKAAMRAFGRIYAAWALSQDFYRAGLHLSALKAPDLETFLRTDWEERFGRRAAADLYAQLRCWHAGDISANPQYNGDLAAALRAIKARVLLMPGETDLYFRVADNEAELPYLRDAELCPIPSIWGHRAGNPALNPEDTAFIKAQVRRWLV